MNMHDPSGLIKEVIDVHGGEDLWNSIEALDAVVTASGFLFTAKRRPVLDHVRMKAFAHEPRFTFFDFPREGLTSELVGEEEVNIKDSEGRIVSRREKPRVVFNGLRRQFMWDDLDFVYFAGYATWNYLTAPFIFLRKGFAFEILEPFSTGSASWSRMKVTFPQNIPTHSETQIFYFDEHRYLRRLDYTARVVGSWAHAAHLCDDYRDFGGIKAPTKRRVYPLLIGSRPLPWPTLVGIDIHDIRPVLRQP
ncbi:MAG TPA: hypothetical protein VMU10_04045 [Desulfomonilia bacterium]|nr:hypothetical protein [Desulfomonilia bacterium]